MTDDAVSRLAETLDGVIRRYWLADDGRAELVAALAPVVDELARQRAAEALSADRVGLARDLEHELARTQEMAGRLAAALRGEAP